ncbi:MAG: tetratricopeptide repeat protein [Myxococcota bacterium]
MAGKDKEEFTDLEADFFGNEDLDWLDDDDSEVVQKKQRRAAQLDVAPPDAPPVKGGKPKTPKGALPVAPPPPPPFAGDASGSVVPRDQKEADWAKKVTPAPTDPRQLANAKTLVFSQVPTLPPVDPDEEVTMADGIRMSGPPSELPEDDLPTAQVDRPPAPPADVPAELMGEAPVGSSAPSRPAPPPEPEPEPEPEAVSEPVVAAEPPVKTRDPEPHGAPAPPVVVHTEPPPVREAPSPPSAGLQALPDLDDAAEGVFADDPTGDVPLVRTKDPTPIRMEVPERETLVPPSFSPPIQPRATLPPFGQTDSDSSWREMATSLMNEAAVVTPEVRAELLFRAGWIYHHKLVDMYGAESLYRDALNAGSRNPTLLRELADVSVELNRWNDTAELLQERAGMLDGIAAAESLRESAVIHLRKLQNPGAGVGLLWDSLEANPEDYASLVLLREHLSDVQPERAQVLGRLAKLSDGAVAAEALYEQGRLLEQSDEAEAIEAYHDALLAYPLHGPSFLALESVFEKRGDHGPLGELYANEAQGGGAGAGWWSILAGRHFLEAGRTAEGEEAFASAAAAGWDFAFRERQARLFRVGAWKELAQSLQDEIGRTEGAEKAFLLFRLGWVRERHLSDLDGALAAYREAAQVDPKALPAADAARRVLRQKGDSAALLSWLEARLEGVSEPAARKSLLYRLAETAEDAGDYEAAVRWYGAVVENDSESAAGLAGLSRSLTRTGGYAELQQVYLRRAELAASPDLKAHFLFRSGTVGQSSVLDVDASVYAHRKALEHVPDHLASLEEIIPLLAARGDWDEAGALLRAAAECTADRQLKLILFYRAGRIYAQHTSDVAATRDCLQSCIDLDADFEPALQLGLDLSAAAGDTARVCTGYRSQAARASDPAVRDWSWFASAVMAGLSTNDARGDLRMLLQANPQHVGARSAWETVVIASDDFDALTDLCRSALVGPPTTVSARSAVRLAEILVRRDRTEDAAAVLADLATMQVDDRPLHPAARLARKANALDATAALLSAMGEGWAELERAALLSRRRRDRDASRSVIAQQLEVQPDDLATALVATRIGLAADDRELMAIGQERLARTGSSNAMRTANAIWAAGLLEDLDRRSEARDMFGLALQSCPDSAAAATGLFRCLVADRDAAGIRALAESTRSLDPHMVAAALSLAGDVQGCIAVLEREAADGTSLPALLHLEQAQQQTDDWESAYATLVRRANVTEDETQKRLVESKRRWVLAEKLAHTDSAWEHYQKIHEAEPGDRGITEALARIAGARGETGRAIELLGLLATGASEPAESARYKRRIAEAHIAVGSRADARQAYLDALDYTPNDPEALEGLKQLATEDQDWSSLIQVLQREADLVEGERELTVRREIARVTEEKLGQGRVAIDAWRAVLEIAPQDSEALQQLLALAETEGEWGVFIETGNVLSALARGADRTSLLRRIGVVCIEQLKRDDAIRYFEQAISEEPPDLEAARRLEKLYAKRPDWKGVERALDVQGRVAETDQDRVSALERAARLQLDTHHDREAASRYFQRILKIAPTHEAALRFMASHLFEAGRFDEALPVCERLEPVVENGQDLEDFDTRMELAQFYFYFAEMLRLAGDSMPAMKRYARALELNPTHLASLEAVGPLYCEAQEWKKAERVYRQLLQLSGGQGERHKVAGTYTQLGLVERALGNADKAQKRFNKALEIYPNHVDALKGMALLLEDREDWSNLLNIYNNIIYHATVAEDVIDAYMTKGRILDDHMSRPDKAGQHYQRSLDFKADQPVAMLRLAELEMRKDNYREAAQIAEKAARVESEDTDRVRPLLLLCQAMGRHSAGKLDEAQALLAQVRASKQGAALAAGALGDLEALRQFIKDALPK